MYAQQDVLSSILTFPPLSTNVHCCPFLIRGDLAGLVSVVSTVHMYSTFAFGKESREAGWTRFQIERNLPGTRMFSSLSRGFSIIT